MSTEEYLNAMDEAIAAYKQEQREQAERMLIQITRKFFDAYKEYNPDGDYITIAITNGNISINNAFWAKDSEKPINCYDDGEFHSLRVKFDEEEQEDVND